ncbi:hypothetical protein DWQ65_10600 [Treponema phagedenis]|uniref:Uncharacterized protein n=1 Tax=Treponema phagedenis TaxID=162 RepID=A0A0B7GX03_TREPH|nr:hypothetical protein [Treponema phagedenis]QSI00497.1 hypothetical protein DWQ65_10600 [Treponema phagedenis]CEM62097.1 conserved membrane hypothetical protein [Treponema phagedenis]
MPDLLISEILILLLLLPPLIRPFSKYCRQIDGVPLLPLLAFVLCVLIFFGQGVSLSFLPVAGFVIIVQASEVVRFFKLLQDVPNGFYTVPEMLLRVFLLLLFATVVYFVFLFAPESTYKPSVSINETVFSLHVNNQKIHGGVVLSSSRSVKEKPNVIFLSGLENMKNPADTVARVLAEKGYTVFILEVLADRSFSFYIRPPRFFIYASLYRYFFLKKPIERTQVADSKKIAECEDFLRSLSELTRQSGKTFVFAEGAYTHAFLQFMEKEPSSFDGAFFLFPSEEAAKNFSGNDSWITKIKGGDKVNFFDVNPAAPFCFFYSDDKTVGFGELAAEDVLAAKLLGTERDIGRQQRLALSGIFEKWLYIRGNYDIN